MTKLEENSAYLASLDQGLGARLRRMIRRLFSAGETGKVYELQFVDPITRACSTESLDFGVFAEETGKKVRFLGSLAQRGGPSARRVEGMSEDQAYKFLQRNIQELQSALRTFAALEDYFSPRRPASPRPASGAFASR